jgi:hypothetical protein
MHPSSHPLPSAVLNLHDDPTSPMALQRIADWRVAYGSAYECICLGLEEDSGAGGDDGDGLLRHGTKLGRYDLETDTGGRGSKAREWGAVTMKKERTRGDNAGNDSDNGGGHRNGNDEDHAMGHDGHVRECERSLYMVYGEFSVVFQVFSPTRSVLTNPIRSGVG